MHRKHTTARDELSINSKVIRERERESKLEQEQGSFSEKHINLQAANYLHTVVSIFYDLGRD